MKKVFLGLSLLFSTFTFTQNMLTINDMIELNRLSGNQLSPDGSKILFQMSKVDILENKSQGGVYIYDLAKKEYQPILKEKEVSFAGVQWSNDNTIWYLSNANKDEGMQVWNATADGKNRKQITHEKGGIEGFKISNDGKLMVLIIKEKTGTAVTDLYPDYTKNQVRIIDDLMYRHWDQWNDENHNQLYYVNLENKTLKGEKKAIASIDEIEKVNPPFGGSEAIAITADNQTIFYSYKNKKGKEFALSTNTDIYAYDVTSGNTTNITEANKGYDNGPILSDDGQYLGWLQMKHDGYEADKNDIVLYDIKTKKTTNLTSELDITVSSFIFAGKKIYMIIPFKGCEQIFELEIATKKMKQLTFTTADYTSISLGKNSLIATRQSMIEPTDLFQIDLKTNKATQLTEVNGEYLKTIAKPTIKEVWVKTTDGKDMLVWHILPPNFDENKKYPTLLYCQGGPQGMVSQFFSYRWNFMLMASQGYVVVAPNRRGLPGFGVEWNEQISGDWGGQAMKDYLSAADEAKENHSYVDGNRMGAVGASYGGYSVYFLAGIHQNRFKTFIAHCGLFNLTSWYGVTEELFFANWDNKGPYWLEENKAYYEKNSPHQYVQNWNTPILVIQGEQDFRVPLDQGLQAFQAAQLKGIKSKLLYFKNEGHWVQMPQNAAIWHQEFYKWLKETL